MSTCERRHLYEYIKGCMMSWNFIQHKCLQDFNKFIPWIVSNLHQTTNPANLLFFRENRIEQFGRFIKSMDESVRAIQDRGQVHCEKCQGCKQIYFHLNFEVIITSIWEAWVQNSVKAWTFSGFSSAKMASLLVYHPQLKIQFVSFQTDFLSLVKSCSWCALWYVLL